jgi:hypothetical protein
VRKHSAFIIPACLKLVYTEQHRSAERASSTSCCSPFNFSTFVILNSTFVFPVLPSNCSSPNPLIYPSTRIENRVSGIEHPVPPPTHLRIHPFTGHESRFKNYERQTSSLIAVHKPIILLRYRHWYVLHLVLR